MRDPQEVRTTLAKNNKERIEELRDTYVDMFMEQVEAENAKCIMYPVNIQVELVQDIKAGTMTNKKRSAEYNLQALYMAEEKLKAEKGFDKVRVKNGKFFTRDYKLSIAKRLCGRVRIE
ncbi:MAG: hypothetical protein K2H53_03200 [Clostridia bacterium]|nr:hypothetical protein [Clostridia bacterium]